jgi:hypothetical protein
MGLRRLIDQVICSVATRGVRAAQRLQGLGGVSGGGVDRLTQPEVVKPLTGYLIPWIDDQ